MLVCSAAGTRKYLAPALRTAAVFWGTPPTSPTVPSDDIVPAALSSGEYVIPAHVVSALGNGDNKAGARALDAMQKNVRLKVGRAMIRNQHPTGKNRARRPEAYMKGGT